MEFVSFEIAKKLKEKGYPQVKKNTIAMYDENGNWYSLIDTFDYFKYSFEDFKEHGYICPTISQVLKWLRDNKNICVEINCNYTDYFPTVRLIDYHQTDYVSGCDIYKTYEKAELAGIEYVLDNLI